MCFIHCVLWMYVGCAFAVGGPNDNCSSGPADSVDGVEYLAYNAIHSDPGQPLSSDDHKLTFDLKN
jgi:hypothetical protein